MPWVRSGALGFDARVWLNGHSRGKLFLDWSAYARVALPLALTSLWLILAYTLCIESYAVSTLAEREDQRTHSASCRPCCAPRCWKPQPRCPLNPDNCGLSGASQFESTLVILAILLLLPFVLIQYLPAELRRTRAGLRRPGGQRESFLQGQPKEKHRNGNVSGIGNHPSMIAPETEMKTKLLSQGASFLAFSNALEEFDVCASL